MVSAQSVHSQNIDLLVLGQLRSSPGVSRVELARQLSLAPSTVGAYVDRLVTDGFLRERKGETVTAGRPPTIVELSPEAGQFIGIDLDAREVHGASVDFAQRLLRDRSEMIGARESANEVIDRIIQVIEYVRDPSRKLLGIGIAVPGTVDTEAGRIIHYRHIRGWHDIALADEIQTQFDVPVAIENNIRAMAFAEHSFGQARSVDDFVCLGIRSGIGAGVFIGGEIHRGSNKTAGEIGAWPCVANATSSNPIESVQMLEEVASLRAILDRVTEQARAGHAPGVPMTRNRVTLEGLRTAIEASDAVAIQILRESAMVIGTAVTQLSLAIDPQRIIVSGPLAPEEVFVTQLRETVRTLQLGHRSEGPVVVASELGPLAGALGAASLAIESWSPVADTESKDP